MTRPLAVGDVLLVSLPVHTPAGHEQEGLRPAVVVAAPALEMRYPLVIIVPLTTQSGPWTERNPAVYPSLSAGTGGLTRSSVVLIDQVRALDLRRAPAYIGSLAPEEVARSQAGLRLLFGL